MTAGTCRQSRATIRVFAAAGLIAATANWPLPPGRFVGNATAADLLAYSVVADGIPEPIGATAGDARRGRALILAREAANCLLCHGLRDPDVRFAGDLGPPLDGIALKLSAAQLRLRVVDNFRRDPSTIMPSYYRVDDLDRVAAAYRGKPILAPGQVEDIVAYLATLK
jgi:L-cysteine S-thiosulfotransferase